MVESWFVAKTHLQRERWARLNLENQGFVVYLPLYVPLGDSRGKEVVRCFLPGYIFFRCDGADGAHFNRVGGTLGIARILRAGDPLTGPPERVPDWVIQDIMDREKNGLVQLPPRLLSNFKKGDKVKVGGLDAIFDEVKDRKRATVFLSFFSRNQKKDVLLSRLMKAH